VTEAVLSQTALSEGGRCDNCTTWTLRAGDTWGLEYQEQEQKDGGYKLTRHLVPVGQWSLREGLRMSDYLFPHIKKGFAGRNLPIISFQVSLNHWSYDQWREKVMVWWTGFCSLIWMSRVRFLGGHAVT
jgi:hypothetical protein